MPENLPPSQVLHNYAFNYNDTHMALIIDYGSVLNHHESANAQAVRISQLAPVRKLQFQVRMGFVCGNRNVLKSAVCMCAITELNIHTDV